MTEESIEVRHGVTFELDAVPFSLDTNRYGELELRSKGVLVDTVSHGGYVFGDWQVLEPDGNAAPGVIAVLVKRSQRYLAGLAARGFIARWNVHDGAKPVNLRHLIKRRGGRTNKHGDLYPGVSARLMAPPAGFQVFWRDEDDENRRHELLALAIAARELDRDSHGIYGLTLDYDFTDTLNTRPDLHWFATLLLVPAELASHAHSMEFAYWLGEELKVDPARVHDAHRLWEEITDTNTTPSRTP